MSLLILFIVSAAVFVGANAATVLRDGSNRPSWRFNAVALVLGLHLVSGVFQYYIQVTRDVQKWL